MLYVVLTILLVAVGCFAFLPRFKKTIERYSVGVNFILTLLATLVGVLVAISISEYRAQQAQKEDVVKLLNAAIETVDTSLDYSTSMNVYVQSLQNEQLVESVYKNNDLPAPTYLDDIIVQPIVSKNISPIGLGAINNLIIINKYLNSDLKNLARYIINLQTLKEVLESEVEYQSDLIDLEQLERRVELLKQRLGEQLKEQQGAAEAAP